MSTVSHRQSRHVRNLKCFLGKHFPIFSTKLFMRRKLGYDLDMNHPKSLNQKMQWLKIKVYSHDQSVADRIDKYKVRSIIEKAGLGHTLTKLYGVWSNASEIDWDSLPNEFVIKCNHGSGYNIICRDKTHFDTVEATKKLDRWMHENYGYENAELIYDLIEHKIICEELIKTEDGLPPKDYKVFCSYGEPKLLFVAQDRYEGHTKFDYYDTEWNWIDVRNGHPNAAVHMKKPDFADELFDAARILSKDYPIVRVDFYHENGRLYFGELTFLHFGGVQCFEPSSYDFKFGELFPLDTAK